MEGSQNFDRLPSELKMMILQLCDFRSLRNIVHASPAIHSFYLSNREELLALIIIRQVADRGFNFLGRYNVIEAAGTHESIHEAAKELYSQCQRHVSTNGKHVIRLDVPSTLALLKIEHAIGWKLKPAKGRRQAKLKYQKLAERMQRRENLHYEIFLLASQEGPAWGGFVSEIMYKMAIYKFHDPRYLGRNLRTGRIE